MNNELMQEPWVLGYAETKTAFDKTYKILMEGGKVDPLEDIETLETFFIAGISWYVSGAQQPDGLTRRRIDELTKQISLLTEKGNLDYALQYADSLIEELKSAQDKLTKKDAKHGQGGLFDERQ